MIQQKIFYLVLLFCSVLIINGCENTYDPVGSTPITNTDQVHAVIGLNDNPFGPDRVDSVLTNRLTVISSLFSTGNIVRREWRVYRLRTGLLIQTDTVTFLSPTFLAQDTLVYKLKVFGNNGSVDSAKLTLRILNSFGVGSSGDISLYSYGSGEYKLLLPYGRIDLQILTNPKSVGTHTGWNNPMPLTDSVVGRGYLLPLTVASQTIVEFNYFAGQNIWSMAQGSLYKTPGSANTYSVKFINGSIYPINGGPAVIVPGRFGDTVARYDATVDSLIIYPNHLWIPIPIGTPWIEMNLYSFVPKHQSVYGNTDYGRIAVPISLVRSYQNQIKYRFGGNLVADMTHSPIYNSGYLVFQFVSPRPINDPWQVGDKVKVIGPSGQIEEIIIKSS